MNLIPKIAEMLGVEIGEVFKLKSSECEYDELYRLGDGLEIKGEYGFEKSCRLKGLLTGAFEIIKLPFEPKEGDRYWHVYWICPNYIKAVVNIWNGIQIDYMNNCCGNVFRTQEEAEALKYEVYERLTGEKWHEVAECTEDAGK